MACLIHKLDENTWRLEEEGSCNVYMYLLTGTQRGLLLDAGLGTVDLKQIVASITDLPVTVLCTHGHFDHIGGLGWFDTVQMHRADQGVWLEHKDLCPRLTPDFLAPPGQEPEWFDGAFRMDLGDRPLEIICTPGHTKGCIAVLDSSRRWLFTGDTCCKAAVLLNFDHSDTLETFRASIVSLLQRRAEYDITWPAHHGCPVETQVLEQFLEAADLLLEGKAQGQSMENPFGTCYGFGYQDVAILYK